MQRYLGVDWKDPDCVPTKTGSFDDLTPPQWADEAGMETSVLDEGITRELGHNGLCTGGLDSTTQEVDPRSKSASTAGNSAQGTTDKVLYFTTPGTLFGMIRAYRKNDP